MKKSVSLGYTLMLLILLVRNCENMETLEKFAPRLINISDQGKLNFVLGDCNTKDVTEEKIGATI